MFREIAMSTDPRKLLQLQPVVYDEPITRRPKAEPPPFIDLDLDRPSGWRQRHRVLVSAQQLLSLFDHPGDRSRLH
jgi:hypothetical protein